MRSFIMAMLSALCLSPSTAWADQEASNVAAVFTGPYGRCYAKSIPDHIYDPESGPRQQGRTLIYRVEAGEDTLIDSYNWFSSKIYLLCAPDSAKVIRLGPWHRGHDPQADHLAIAFYQGGKLTKRYSTLDISGSEQAEAGSFSILKNVSASVSHYTVFDGIPELTRTTSQDGVVFSDVWTITAKTIDGRELVFDPVTGTMK